MKLVSLLALWLMGAVSANAAALSESAIRAQLFGLTLSGEYSSGAPWSEVFRADGTTVYTDSRGEARGTMEFQGNQLCFKYTSGADMSGGCFEVWKRGRNCFDFYGSSETGTEASYTQKVRGLGWDARGWSEGTAKDCVADLIS
ncbi:hypothetical protein ACFQ14_09910 [Pseudahrensia aquimaris]|uniref:Uncharacterized protein n=1 Tax=Pseudahrensia aquimaris TaxID=744461 RepID=A0ABW3FKP5_9HYPH